MFVLFRLMVAVGRAASWFPLFIACVIAVFVGYVGVALWAVLHASDQQRDVRYRVFRDLLDLFRRGGGR